MSVNVPVPVTIAIIGGGLIGPRHAQSITKSENASLVALVDPAPYGPELAASLNTTHFNSVSELIASPQKPTAAIVCTPNHTHVALSKELISAGIHVLVEKPLSTSVDDGKELIAHAMQHNTQLLAGHHRRFNPYVVATKLALARNEVGRVLAVSGVWALCKPPSYFEGHLAWHKDVSAGSILINLVHDIDLLQFFFGPVRRVHAERSLKTRGFDADEGAAVIFKFNSGVVGTFIVSDASPSPFNFESGTGENPLIPKVDCERGAGGFYRIFGTEGSLSIPDMTKWSHSGEKSWRHDLKTTILEIEESTPFDSQVEHFCRVVRGEEEPMCSGEEGLSALVVCEAVQKAMDSGEAVDILQTET